MLGSIIDRRCPTCGERGCHHPERILTERELELVRYLAATGARNREIAEAFHVSIATVKAHLEHAMRAAHCRSRVELALWAWRNLRHEEEEAI